MVFNPTRSELGPDRTLYGSEPILPVLSQMRDYLGVLMRHDEQFYKNFRDAISLTSGVAANTEVYQKAFNFKYRSLIIDNPSGYTLIIPELFTTIPPNVFGYLVTADTPPQTFSLRVLSGTQGSTVTAFIRVSERPVVVGTIATQIAITNSTTSPSLVGAANASVSNLTAGASATLAVARPTRVGLTVINEGNADNIRIAPGAGVATATVGLLVPHNASVTVTDQQLISFAAVTGTPAVSIWDEYN